MKTAYHNNQKLNNMQKAFVYEYIKDLDPAKAAIRVGYSDSNAENTAKTFLENPLVVTEIKKAIKEQTKRLQIEKSYILDKLLSIIEFSLDVEDILDKEGNPTGKQKLRDTASGFKALEILAKHTGFSSDRDAAKPPEPNIIHNLDGSLI